MKINAGCELWFDAQADTPIILMLRPRSGASQWIVSEEYDIEPSVPVVEFTDVYGNLCQRLIAPPGQFRIRTQATVETAATIDVLPGAPYIAVENLPDEALHFLLQSRYCPSDQPDIAKQASNIVGTVEPGYDQAEAIRAWINKNIKYEYGTSDATTSALDTLHNRTGVCRDFTHLGISLCRSLNIPARMVVGYLHNLKPMDLHAWFEAFVGGRWYVFDATQSEPRGNRITVAYGRDAADVAFLTQFGPMTLERMQVWVDEEVPPTMQLPTVSVLGCGWLGLPLAERLVADGYPVKGSTTTPEKLSVLTTKGIQPYQIKLLPQPDGDLEGFLQTDILLVDIPPKAGAQGLAFHPTQISAVADAVVNSPVKWVIYISSTSVYPELSRVVTEEDVTTPDESADPAGSPAQLVAAEQLIYQLSPTRQTTVLRCAGLMGYDRIPGKYVSGKTVDSGRVPVNYIHRDDAVGLITAVLANQLTGTYNIVAPEHPNREAVYRASCAQFGYALPVFIEPVMALPFKIVSGQKLTGQLDYLFQYSNPLLFPYGTPV